MNANNVILDQKAPPVALLAAVTQLFGPECYSWDPSVLAHELRIFVGQKVTGLQLDRINAAIHVLTSDDYDHDWHLFQAVNRLFYGTHTDLDTHEPNTLEELLVGMADVMSIRHEPLKLEDQVKAYAGIVLHEEGVSSNCEGIPDVIWPVEGKPSDRDKYASQIFSQRLEDVAEYMEKQ